MSIHTEDYLDRQYREQYDGDGVTAVIPTAVAYRPKNSPIVRVELLCGIC